MFVPKFLTSTHHCQSSLGGIMHNQNVGVFSCRQERCNPDLFDWTCIKNQHLHYWFINKHTKLLIARRFISAGRTTNKLKNDGFRITFTFNWWHHNSKPGCKFSCLKFHSLGLLMQFVSCRLIKLCKTSRYYTTKNKIVGDGYICFTPSVRPSVRLLTRSRV